MTSIVSWNRSKNHSHDKLNGKQQLHWSCSAFITSNMGKNTATKSLSARKTAENSHVWKSPYNALQAQYWINVGHVCQWIVSLLMPYWFKLQNYFDNTYLLELEWWCCWHYIYNWIEINVSKFLGFFVWYFGKLHLDVLNELLKSRNIQVTSQQKGNIIEILFAY